MRYFVILLALLCIAANDSSITDLVQEFKFDYSGAIDNNYVGTNRLTINFDQAVAATLTPNVGAYSFTVNGTPVRGNDGTYPLSLTGAQGFRWYFDGVGDYLSLADGAGGDDFDPGANDFSGMCVITPYDVTAVYQALMAKFDSGAGKRSWWFGLENNDIRFAISKDGGGGASLTALNLANVFLNHEIAIVGFAYEEGGDGTSDMTVWNNVSTVTATTGAAVSPIDNSDVDFVIAGSAGGFSPFKGFMHGCWYWPNVAMTGAQFDFISQQFRGMLSDGGLPVTTVSAAPPAIPLVDPTSGTEPILLDMPPNINMTSRAGMYSADAITNRVHRSSFESALTGWTATLGGGATATGDLTTYAHGWQSAKVVLSNVGDSSSLVSNCQTAAINRIANVSMYGRSADATNTDLNILEYASGDCSGGVLATTAMVNNANWTATWLKGLGTMTAGAWNGGTNSYEIEITETFTGASSVVFYDAVTVTEDSVGRGGYANDAFCGCDTGADCVCTTVVNAAPYPLRTMDSFTIELTADTPATSPHVRFLYFLPGTAGTANRLRGYTYSNSMEFGIFDSDGVGLIYYYPGGVVANTDMVITNSRSMSSGAVNFGYARVNATSSGVIVGAGNGILDGYSADIYLGSGDTSGSNSSVRSFKFFRRFHNE